jgi:hypothetical protein
MKDLQSDIFSVSGHLSKDQLVRYHRGEMQKDERYAVEKHLVDCELCKDALSGMAAMHSYKGIDKIRADIRRIARPKAGIMNQIAWRNFVVSLVVLAILMLAAFAYIYFVSMNKQKNNSPPSNEIIAPH